MPCAVTKDELTAWLEGHRAANQRHRDEIAAMTPAEKLRQISRLMSFAGMFDMSRQATSASSSSGSGCGNAGRTEMTKSIDHLRDAIADLMRGLQRSGSRRG